MNNDNVINTLNALTKVCFDSEQGFRACAARAVSGYLRALMADRADRYARAAQDLQQIVVCRGGQPLTANALSAAMHRGWVDARVVMRGTGDEALLTECERNEEGTVARYRAALEKDLPVSIYAILNHQYLGFLQNHELIKSVRDKFLIYG